MDTQLRAQLRARACRKGLFAGQASFGRNVSKTEWVYGIKVALVVDPDGIVSAFGLAPANCDERTIGDALIAQDRHDAYLVDKGFSSVEQERHWLQTYGTLVAATPKNSDRRAWPRAARRWASGKRQIIEGVISQLKDQFALERHRARTIGGLLARLAAKDAAVAAAEAAAGDGKGRIIYGSTKRAINRWVRRTAPTDAWAGAGIPLNAVAPGVVDTPRVRTGVLDDPATKATVRAAMPQPLGFPGPVEPVASLLTWMVGSDNSFVTGQVIFIDGGADATLRGEDTEVGEVRYGAGRRARLLVKYLAARLRQRIMRS